VRLFLAPFIFAAFTPADSATGGLAEVSVTALPELKTCAFTRILPSPSGGSAVVWVGERSLVAPLQTTEPGDFVLATLPAGGDRKLALATVQAPARIEALRWSGGADTLLFRFGENGAGILDARVRSFRAAEAMDSRWSNIRIRALSHGDLGFYGRADALQTIDRVFGDGAPLRASASVGETTTILTARYGNRFKLIAYSRGARWNSRVTAHYAQLPLVPEGERRVAFMGDQQGWRTFLPYAQQLVDLSSGRVIGRFGWERIEVRRGDTARSLEPLRDLDQLKIIQDAAMSGGTIYALVELEREMRIVTVRGSDVHSYALCRKEDVTFGRRHFPALNALPEGLSVSRRFVDLRGRGRAVGPFAHLYTPARADGRLVVHFHGGPTQTAAGTLAPPEVAAFAAIGVAVLEVEYSGMLGGGLGLTERLPRRGMRALASDVAAVTRWVRSAGYREITVLGSSFGGAPAAIAAADYPHVYRNVVFGAPLLHVRPTEQSVRRHALIAKDPTPASQLEFEETVYGGAAGRAAFDRSLRAYVGRLTPSSRLSFYFGGIDPVSGPEDLPAAFRGSASVVVLPRIGHEYVGEAVIRGMAASMVHSSAPAERKPKP
jgi:hypothetical protein